MRAQPEISQDGRVWTFRLKPGTHYAPPLQDRTVSSRDIVRGILRHVATCESCPSGIIGSIFAPFNVIEGFAAYVQRRATSISGLETPDNRPSSCV